MSSPLGEFGGKSLLKDAMGFDLGDRGWWTQAEGWIKGGFGKEWAEGGLDRESESLAEWDLRFKRKKTIGILKLKSYDPRKKKVLLSRTQVILDQGSY